MGMRETRFLCDEEKTKQGVTLSWTCYLACQRRAACLSCPIVKPGPRQPKGPQHARLQLLLLASSLCRGVLRPRREVIRPSLVSKAKSLSVLCQLENVQLFVCLSG